MGLKLGPYLLGYKQVKVVYVTELPAPGTLMTWLDTNPIIGHIKELGIKEILLTLPLLVTDVDFISRYLNGI